MRARDIAAVGIDAAGTVLVAGGGGVAAVAGGRLVALEQAPPGANVAAFARRPDGRLFAADARACVLYDAAPGAAWTVVAGVAQPPDLDRRRPRSADGPAAAAL